MRGIAINCLFGDSKMTNACSKSITNLIHERIVEVVVYIVSHDKKSHSREIFKARIHFHPCLAMPPAVQPYGLTRVHTYNTNITYCYIMHVRTTMGAALVCTM